MTRWECRHAPAEMLYLEVRDEAVVEYFDHHPDDPTEWTFEEVRDGAIDAKVRMLFGDDVLAALHAEVAAGIERRR